jgi:type I restriction enzyme, R subunit
MLGELDERMPSSVGGASVTREVQPAHGGEPQTEAQLRQAIGDRLHDEVDHMNLDNFIVRPKRRLVEKFKRADAWIVVSPDDRMELAHEVAGLPSELDPEAEEAKRFDLLLLNLQLAVLRHEPWFERLRDQVKAIAGLLEEKSAIPMVREQMPLIQDLQTDEWWQDVTAPMLESVRRRLRDLVRLIDKQQRRPVYTDFEDQMGTEAAIDLPGFGSTADFEKFRTKARSFLRANQDHIAIHKLRTNRTLTPADLSELDRMLAESGVGRPEDISRAKRESEGLGLFVRTLVGLDRDAARQAMASFLAGRTMSANQIEFVNLIVEHLTEHGIVEAARPGRNLRLHRGRSVAADSREHSSRRHRRVVGIHLPSSVPLRLCLL